MNKKLHSLLFSFIAIMISHSALAQSEVYFRESFNPGEGEIGSTSPTAPLSGYFETQTNSGTWYIYGAYRTTGATGVCFAEPSHLRFGNLTAVTSATDSAYIITPTVNFGINELSYYNGRASRRVTIYKTADTSAVTNAWSLVAYNPATITACQFYTISVNDPNAKRLKIITRGGTDSDLDSFTVTSTTAILPVVFTGVNAMETSGKIKVSWKVATELNTASYVVERSDNGVSFKQIGTLTANNAGMYSWIDNNPVAGNSFYRIRAVDKDAFYSFTGIVKINLNKKNVDFTIAPNPVKGNQVNVQIANFERGTYSVKLINNNGQQLYNKTYQNEGGSSSIQLTLPGNIKTGVYNVQIIQGSNNIIKKLIVE